MNGNPSQLPSVILPQEILAAINDVTDMWRNAGKQFKGDALINFHDKVLMPEVDKIQAKISGCDVLWSQEYRKFGIFVGEAVAEEESEEESNG
jgi:hypothetical protein